MSLELETQVSDCNFFCQVNNAKMVQVCHANLKPGVHSRMFRFPVPYTTRISLFSSIQKPSSSKISSATSQNKKQLFLAGWTTVQVAKRPVKRF